MKRMQRQTKRQDCKAFTLIELLVVITILAILIGLLMPAVSRTLSSGKAVACGSNVKQISMAMIAYDGDYGQLPWHTEGTYKGSFDLTGGQTDSKFTGTNWNDKLIYFKYLPPGAKDKGIWLCAGASRQEVYGLDTSGNKANYGGYGLCYNIFRQENTLNSKANDNSSINVAQRPLKLSRIPRPSLMWMVGDCGRPLPNSEPGSGRYIRTSNYYYRPGVIGEWDFTASYTAPSPALRHNGDAVYASFDGHSSKLDAQGLLSETNNFTARGETF